MFLAPRSAASAGRVQETLHILERDRNYSYEMCVLDMTTVVTRFEFRNLHLAREI